MNAGLKAYIEKKRQGKVGTSPANYTPNVIPSQVKHIAEKPEVKKVKYARKNMPNIQGFEPVYQMSKTKMNDEVKNRKMDRIKKGL